MTAEVILIFALPDNVAGIIVSFARAGHTSGLPRRIPFADMRPVAEKIAEQGYQMEPNNGALEGYLCVRSDIPFAKGRATARLFMTALSEAGLRLLWKGALP